MENKTKTAIAIAGIALLGLGGVAGASLFPKTEQVEVPVEVEKIVTQTVTVPVEVPVEVIKYVNVTDTAGNDNLQLVLEHIYDNNGEIEYLLDNLDDDEVDQIVDRVVFINDIKAEALNYVQKELADELDGEVVNGTEIDEDDVEKIRLDNDMEDVLVEEVDFEDRDAIVTVSGKFRHDDVWYVFESEVEFEDGEIESFEITSVNLN